MKFLPGLDPVSWVGSLPGVLHVVAVNDDGTFAHGSSRSANYPESRAGLIQFVNSVENALTASAAALSQNNEMQWQPVSNWLYTGGEWGVCVTRVKDSHQSGPRIAAFFRTAHANIGAIFNAMVASDWAADDKK